jgi:GT2 family glycosyltransferase
LIASIVIVTYGQRALTEQCLRSLECALGDRLGDTWEIVVVDNNSPDDTPALLRDWSDRATVRLLGQNRNFAGGCNLGAAEARGEVLVFLNNDTEVPAGALETIVAQAREPGVGVAGCRLLFPDGTIQHAGVAFLRSPALGVPMPQHVFHHQDQALAPTGGSFEADCVTAACMAVRANAFAAVGGFDEGYVNGLEDVDLCLKLRVAGHRIVYRGDVTVIHHEGASRGQGDGLWATPEKLATMRNNDLRFVSRWGASLDQDDQLAADLWDGALEPVPPARIADPADLVLVGQPGGIGAAGDECRALLAALSACGRAPAALDAPAALVVPRLDGPLAQLLAQARRRRPIPGADWLFVPSGEHDRADLVAPAIVRLASSSTAIAPIEDAVAVWAASPSVARALADDGLVAERIRVVPPPVLPATRGEGGAGVLAVLPVQLPGLAAAVLSALRVVGARSDVRLLPTVWSRSLELQVAEQLPGAELLRPCSDETRYAALAGASDLVVALDPADRFERRALVAAGVGTTPITGDPHGPAAAVLGDQVACEPLSPGALARALDASLDAALAPPPEARATRRATVAGACGLEAFAAHLASLRPSPVVA